MIFDRALLRARLARALAIGAEPFLLARAAEDLDERLGSIRRDFSDILDFGTPGPEAAAICLRRFAGAKVVRLGEAGSVPADMPVDDLEAPALAGEEWDCIVSLLTLQTCNDLPGVLAQIRRALKPDGLFIAALMGGDTLTELRAALLAAEEETTGGASPRVAPFADVRSLGQLLQRAGFALPVADSEVVVVRYSHPLSLMRDLRAMGATNVLADRSRRPMRRATLMRAMEIYQQRFADADGKVRATFEMVWLLGWAPHDSQQRPLRPGSARMRLADALKPAAYTEDPPQQDKP